jgi:hypothetical protein
LFLVHPPVALLAGSRLLVLAQEPVVRSISSRLLMP